MKRLIVIIPIFFSCHLITTWGDVLYEGSQTSRNLKRENVYKIIEGETTEKEIKSLFGTEYVRRLSFYPSLVKKYRKKSYDITRIILYANPTLNERDAMAAMEQFELSIFFKHGIVQFYFVNHVGNMGNGIWGPLGYDKFPRAKNLREKEFDGFDWPDVVCDIQFYERKVKKIWFQDNWRKIQKMTYDKCAWETEKEWEEKIERQTSNKPTADIYRWRKQDESKRLKDFE